MNSHNLAETSVALLKTSTRIMVHWWYQTSDKYHGSESLPFSHTLLRICHTGNMLCFAPFSECMHYSYTRTPQTDILANAMMFLEHFAPWLLSSCCIKCLDHPKMKIQSVMDFQWRDRNISGFVKIFSFVAKRWMKVLWVWSNMREQHIFGWTNPSSVLKTQNQPNYTGLPCGLGSH